MRPVLGKLQFADMVSHCLSEFGHTYNLDMVSKSELFDIYNEARAIIAEETKPEDDAP